MQEIEERTVETNAPNNLSLEEQRIVLIGKISVAEDVLCKAHQRYHDLICELLAIKDKINGRS